ncbi:MAG: hypothetical protein ACPGJE_07005 [Wenzhouxiangellaceae bacterium]
MTHFITPAPSEPETLDWLNPYFLGAYAENDTLLEVVLVEFLRDHCYWRRNVHPEDPPLILMLASDARDYRGFVARMKTELHGLSARLKNTVPFYNPPLYRPHGLGSAAAGPDRATGDDLGQPDHVTDETSAPPEIPVRCRYDSPSPDRCRIH